MKERTRARLLGASAALLGLVFADDARANSEDNARTAQAELADIDRESSSVQTAIQRANAQRLSPEQRVANGELLYRSKDYTRAAVVLSEIIEEYENTASYPDALWLRGETYYASREYLSARRDYRKLVERGTEPRFQPYFGKALARLVDVSLRIGDVASLDEVFQKLNQVPPAQVDAGLLYAKGKAYFAKKDYSEAEQAFAQVGSGTLYSHQARYFQGILAMRRAAAQAPAGAANPSDPKNPVTATPVNYKTAVEAFRTVTELPPDSDDHKQVIDLAWMAIGRLFYEMEQYQQASEAYSHVGRESTEFDTMLYELAWVYVRIGDVERAERSLEVLSVADPSSPYVGEGTLLRADLLLRAGAFDKALQLYQDVRAQFDPMREKVENFLDSTTDVAVFYEKLSQQQLDVVGQGPDQLPSLALKWAREAEDGPMAFAVIDDVNECRTLIRESNTLIDRLTALTQASNRVRAFPEIEAGEEKALGLLNRIARARLEVARGLDTDEAVNVSGELAAVRNDRRQLMGMMAQVPTNSAEFAARETQGVQQWNVISQELTRGGLEIDQLQAIVNGLRRMLREDAQRGVARDPATLKRFNDEIDANEHDLRAFQDRVTELRKQIEFGRAQIGIGDARYQNDAMARVQFRDLLDREVTLAIQGQAGPLGQRFAQRAQPMLFQARTEEDRLVAAFATLEDQVNGRIGELRAKIEAERAKIADYTTQLAGLDGQAKTLVGEVAKRNFELVRANLRKIVLRADVGITEQAWEVREEEMERVRTLQNERKREETILDEELREVLDDSGEASNPLSIKFPNAQGPAQPPPPVAPAPPPAPAAPTTPNTGSAK